MSMEEDLCMVLRGLIRIIDNQMEIKNHIGITSHNGYHQDSLALYDLKELLKKHERAMESED